jgi:hypothetical protein
VAEGSTPTEPRGQLPIAVQGARRIDSHAQGHFAQGQSVVDYELLLAAVDLTAAGTWRVSV